MKLTYKACKPCSRPGSLPHPFLRLPIPLLAWEALSLQGWCCKTKRRTNQHYSILTFDVIQLHLFEIDSFQSTCCKFIYSSQLFMEITVLLFRLQVQIQAQKKKEWLDLAVKVYPVKIFTGYLAWRHKLGTQQTFINASWSWRAVLLFWP